MTKVSSLVVLTGAGVDQATDLLEIIDMSETGAARNKKITIAQFLSMVSAGAASLDELSDVDLAGAGDGDILVYDLSNGVWVPAQPDAGGATALDELTDVEVPTPVDGDVLTWDESNLTWVAAPPSGGPGGASALDDLTDVDTTGLTAGDVLTFDGANWVPQAVSAGGRGDLVYIGSYTPSAVASFDIENFAGLSGYGKIIIEIEHLQMSADSIGLNMQYKLGGSYQSGANYKYSGDCLFTTTEGNQGSTGATSIALTITGAGGIGAAAGEGLAGTITLHNPYDTTNYKRSRYDLGYTDDQATPRQVHINGNGHFTGTSATAALEGIRINSSSGTITAVVHVYGLLTSGSPSGGTLDGLTDVDVATAVDGDVLVYDASNQQWYPADPRTGHWVPTEPIASDFSTVRNNLLPAPTISDNTPGSGVRMTFLRNSTGSSWRQGYLLTAAPAVPFRAEAKICTPWQSSNNWHVEGLAIGSTNGADVARHVRIAAMMDGNQTFPYSIKNTGLDAQETVLTTINAPSTLAAQDSEFWMAIEWDGTNINTYASFDGYGWWLHGVEPDSFFTGNPDLVGFGFEAVASDGGTQYVWCSHFRITTDLNEPFGLNRVT